MERGVSTDVIEITDLSKSYGSVQVLRGLSLRVAAGEVYGLLGPNGAGKSTLLHLILGFLKPSSGSLRVLGSSNPDSVRPQIGYVPERQRYHTRYTAREYLRFLGTFSGLTGSTLRERVDSELATVGLAEVAERGLGTFSKGMLQRLGVAQALLMDPDLLLIDEPTSGLDPAGQREVVELLNQVRVRGHTVLLCTHYLHEVEQLCDRVGVLAGGRIATEVIVADLHGEAGSVRILVTNMTLETRLRVEALGTGIRCDTQSVQITANTPALQATVLRALLDDGVLILALEPAESPLERLYLQAVRGAAVEPTAPWAALLAPSEPKRGESDTLLNELLGHQTDKPPPLEPAPDGAPQESAAEKE